MLAIQAHYHEGHIQLDQLAQQGIPRDADVVVLFLPKSTSLTTPLPTNSAAALSTVAASLSPEQRAAWHMQSQSGFAQTDLLNPAEDVWNHA